MPESVDMRDYEETREGVLLAMSFLEKGMPYRAYAQLYVLLGTARREIMKKEDGMR